MSSRRKAHVVQQGQTGTGDTRQRNFTWQADAMFELKVYDTEFRAHGRVMRFQVEHARVAHWARSYAA